VLIAVKKTYPFLISIPHGGTEVPEIVRPLLALTETELAYHCDPQTREIFGFRDRVNAFIDTPISRMIVDLNRPPLPLPPRDPDGIIKRVTVDGKSVYRAGHVPDISLIHELLKNHYFPYHQAIDMLLDTNPVTIAFDCHSMLPEGSPQQSDAGKIRPLICLGNNGDSSGNPYPGGLATCPSGWIAALAKGFADEFAIPGRVAINDPFSGGFIANAHYWHKGIPWIQIEVNRLLYEERNHTETDQEGLYFPITELREKIGSVLEKFGQITR
jgi:N-formylglutamate deformylase